MCLLLSFADKSSPHDSYTCQTKLFEKDYACTRTTPGAVFSPPPTAYFAHCLLRLLPTPPTAYSAYSLPFRPIEFALQSVQHTAQFFVPFIDNLSGKLIRSGDHSIKISYLADQHGLPVGAFLRNQFGSDLLQQLQPFPFHFRKLLLFR